MPWFKRYDTYCYSERYRTVKGWKERTYSRLKKCLLLTMPKNRIQKKTTDEELPETVGALLGTKK